MEAMFGPYSAPIIPKKEFITRVINTMFGFGPILNNNNNKLG